MKRLIFAAALAAVTLTSPAPSQPAAIAANAEQRLDHISVVKIGSGSPVVLIPGLASPRAVWDGVAPSLTKSHTVYLVQVNGFGGDAPGKNLEPAILDGIVADLSGYLEREKAGPVRLIGHSMGGLAGMMFARAHPDQVERLMIVDALPYFPVLLAPGGEAPSASAVEPIARAMRDRVATRYGKPIDSQTVAADTAGLALKPESRARMAGWAAAADPRVTAQLLYEDLTTDLRPRLAEIRIPITLVVPWATGAFGEERTLAFYRRQYAAAPNVRYVGIAEAGHFAMLDQPEKFAEILAAFLE